jgi:hypothetical protein
MVFWVVTPHSDVIEYHRQSGYSGHRYMAGSTRLGYSPPPQGQYEVELVPLYQMKKGERAGEALRNPA